MQLSHKASIMVMIVCTFFTSTGQILWKMGINTYLPGNIYSLLTIPMLFGFMSYGLGAILMLIAFKNGELSILYPIIATSYVWISLLSPFFFEDTMNGWKWAGVIMILLSVSLLGISSRNNHD